MPQTVPTGTALCNILLKRYISDSPQALVHPRGNYNDVRVRQFGRDAHAVGGMVTARFRDWWTRFVFGGSYRAYPYGPVPQNVYGMLKAAENKPGGQSTEGPFRVRRSQNAGQNPVVEALAEPNLDLLSESDLECLNESRFGVR